MQQDHRGGYEDVKPNQDRSLKPMQGDHDQQQQQQSPQKCPRCESLNTKFCYYNNYSLSQPRYFCKACRRYWTLGGTLRNVPVGGGCRKGKRTKTSSSSSSSVDNFGTQAPQPQSQPQFVQQNLAVPQNMVLASATNSGNNSMSPALMRTTNESGNLVSPPAAGISSMGPNYYPGTGFLTSLAAIQSLNNLPAVNLGGLGDHATSNLRLLHGFSTVPSLGSQNHQQHRQFYHMGSTSDDKGVEHSFYPPDHQERLIQSSRPDAANSPHQQQNWHPQGFINNTITNPTVSDTALWSTINTSTTIAANSKGNVNNSSTAGAGSSSLNHLQDQWHDLPAEFGSPP